MSRDRYDSRDTGGWVFHQFVRHSQRAKKASDARRLHVFKIRINLTAAQYITFHKQITHYLLANGDYEQFVAQGLSVIRLFKQVTPAGQLAWEKYGRFNDNGQFTLYLVEPYDIASIQAFIEKLQGFLIGLKVEPVASMATDFDVKGAANISMRLERLAGEVIDSRKLTDNVDLAHAHRLLTQDTSFYHAFSGEKDWRREEENDAIHQVMVYGFEEVRSGFVEFGAECQRVALKLRSLGSQTDPASYEAVSCALTASEWSILEEINLLRSVQEQLMKGMTPIEQLGFRLQVYITRELARLEEVGVDLEAGVGIGLFGLCHEHAALRAAYKMLLHVSTRGEEPLCLTSAECDAALFRRVGLWSEVIVPCGLEKALASGDKVLMTCSSKSCVGGDGPVIGLG